MSLTKRPDGGGSSPVTAMHVEVPIEMWDKNSKGGGYHYHEIYGQTDTHTFKIHQCKW